MLSIVIDSGNLTADPVDDSAKIVSVKFFREENNFPYEIDYTEGGIGVLNQEVAAWGFKKAKLVLNPILVN